MESHKPALDPLRNKKEKVEVDRAHSQKNLKGQLREPPFGGTPREKGNMAEVDGERIAPGRQNLGRIKDD